MRLGLAIAVLLGGLGAGLAPWLALPLALAVALPDRATPFATDPEALPSRVSSHRFDGQDELWDLHGLRLRLGAHRLQTDSPGASHTVSVHDLAALHATGQRLRLAFLDGRSLELGSVQAHDVDDVVPLVNAALERRRRGGLEDRRTMEDKLAAVRSDVQPTRLPRLQRPAPAPGSARSGRGPAPSRG